MDSGSTGPRIALVQRLSGIEPGSAVATLIRQRRGDPAALRAAADGLADPTAAAQLRMAADQFEVLDRQSVTTMIGFNIDQVGNPDKFRASLVQDTEINDGVRG